MVPNRIFVLHNVGISPVGLLLEAFRLFPDLVELFLHQDSQFVPAQSLPLELLGKVEGVSGNLLLGFRVFLLLHSVETAHRIFGQRRCRDGILWRGLLGHSASTRRRLIVE